MSKLLNVEAENGVIIFNSGLTVPFWEEQHPKTVVMRKKKRTPDTWLKLHSSIFLFQLCRYCVFLFPLLS